MIRLIIYLISQFPEGSKVIAHKVSKDSNKNDKIICRQLLEEINKNIIEIIATDGNYSYDKVINKGYNIDCIKHIIDKAVL